MKVITLLTDFGLKDTYVAQMKGVILEITRDVHIVDLSHDITPQNVMEGAFLLYTAVPYFPMGSIHVAVVDPGVGTKRKAIIIETPVCFLVGPDNGILIPSAKLYKDFKVYEIKKDICRQSISSTFHARDVFAPAAALLAKGCSPEDIGKRIESFVDMDIEFGRKEGDRIVGKIMHIDGFGNLITNVRGETILNEKDFGSVLQLNLENKTYGARFLKSYGFGEEKELLLTIGGSGFLEISVNRGNASELLGAKVGDEIFIDLY